MTKVKTVKKPKTKGSDSPKQIKVYEVNGKRYALVGKKHFELPPKGNDTFERFVIASLLRIINRDKKKKKGKKKGKKGQKKIVGKSDILSYGTSSDPLAVVRSLATIKPTVNAIPRNLLTAEKDVPAITAPKSDETAVVPSRSANSAFDPSAQLIIRNKDGSIQEASMAALITYDEKMKKDVADSKNRLKQAEDDLKNVNHELKQRGADKEQLRMERDQLKNEIQSYRDELKLTEEKLIENQQKLLDFDQTVREQAQKRAWDRTVNNASSWRDDLWKEIKDKPNNPGYKSGAVLFEWAVRNGVANDTTLKMMNNRLKNENQPPLTSWSEVVSPDVRDLWKKKELDIVDSVPFISKDDNGPFPNQLATMKLSDMKREEEEEAEKEEQEEEENVEEAEGNGYVGSKNAKGLTTSEINKIMNRKGSYLGTIASDMILPIILPQLKDDRKACFILNLDPLGKPGSHWVAVMI